MAKTKKNASFEKLLQDTEEIVDGLESGELSLDESLKKYEKGVNNLRLCAKLIAQAEEKVKILVETTEDDFTLEDLDNSDDDDDEED